MGLLGWITLLPLFGAALVMLVPREEEAIHRGLGLATAIGTFLVSLLILPEFKASEAGFQLEVDKLWIAPLGIRFHLGIDGISLWLVLLTTFLVPLTLLSPQAIGIRNIRVREFTVAMLVLEAGMVGAFLALDLFLFYVSWEVMLIPMYFIIGIWGGERRLYAAIKFVIYTLVGSLLMLAAILYVYAQWHAASGSYSFDYAQLSHLTLPFMPQMLCFAAFALAFAIKVPIFPLHTWLPDAHVEAPTGGSVILAAVLLKFGAYGFLRFALPMFPLAAEAAAPVIAILAVIGIVYGALMAYVQDDAKKLVAYSSVSHLGFVILGILTLNPTGVQGAIYQMLAHGISTGGLFFAVGLLYDRRHTRRLSDFGGLWKQMPVFAACFMVIMLASVGLPGLCGFVGEFLVLVGTFTANKSWAANGLVGYFPAPKLMAAISATAVILAAMYLLGMYQRLMFGPLDKPENKVVKDIHGRETWVFGLMVAAALVMGLWPQPILERSEKSVEAFVSSYRDRLAEARRAPDAPAHVYPARPARRGADADAASPVAGPAAARGHAMSFDAAQLFAFWPMLILIGMGCLVLLAETFARGAARAGLAWLSIAGCVAALGALVLQWPDAAESQTYFQGMLVVDRMALYLDGAFVVAALITLLVAPPYLEAHGFEFGEFYAMVLFATAGMVMVAHAAHLVSLLIGIETMSLAAYVLTGCWRKSLRSIEGAMKYFLMGAFATGFLVYGIALVYGTTGGELSYAGIASKVNGATNAPLFFMGEYFILIALAFKVAAVPFHMWAPDAYEGAPTPVTGFMAAGVKAAAFGAIVRILGSAFASPVLVFDFTGWASILSVLAVLTMTLGNLAAVRQDNVKRLLAYSSIAHAGYLLIGVVASGLGVASAKPAVLFYLVAYTFTTLGAFAVVGWIGNRKDERLYLDDWAGVASSRPGVALAMTLFLLSLGGVPPTGGFFGKFYLFRAAMESPQLYWLVVVGVLNSVVSIYYYLRIVVAMYFRDPMRPLEPTDGVSMRAGLLITAVAVVLLGIFPGTFVEWAGSVPLK